MNCPRCGTTSLEERDRDGVTIDVCMKCRGVWLDRGELEKLITRATAELDELERRAPRYEADDRRRYEADDRRHYHDDRRHHDDDDDDYRKRHPRKRRWIDSLGDIFD